MTNIGKILIIVITITIFGLIAYLLFSSEVTNKEAGLISLLLTILSFVVSYLISNYFAEISYKKAIEEVQEQHLANLRTYALNAAEKVGNLSNELTRLSLYLQQELDYDEENLEMANHALYERITSTIHLINTLKSVNDTSLSDWRGVIGEELNEQREEQIERENELKELVIRVEDLIKQSNYKVYQTDNTSEIKGIKKDLSMIINSISGNVIKQRVSNKPTKEDISNECPSCQKELKYKQRQNPKSFKPVKCDKCGKKSTARWSAEKGFYLDVEKELESQTNCLWCANDIIVKYSSVPFTSTINVCSNCNGQLKLTTNINGYKVDKQGVTPFKKNILTEELIEQIEKLLPPQPWTKGIHKEVAAQLEVPHYIVQGAITKLIELGKFYPQVNGIVYDRKIEPASAS